MCDVGYMICDVVPKKKTCFCHIKKMSKMNVIPTRIVCAQMVTAANRLKMIQRNPREAHS